jgi:putative ABC transport system permease protein
MDTLLQDLRFALRTLRKSPGFTALAVVCLALGIGVNTTIFSVVNAALLRPFPFAEPERLVAVRASHLKSGIDETGPSYQDFRDWQAGTTAFAGMAAFDYRSLTISDGEEPERLAGSAVTWNLFPLLGVAPQLGRGFREEEDRPGAEGVVLLSDEAWRRRFNADPAVVGRSILVNDAPHTVVGVMPPRFKYPENEELWVPLTPLEHASSRAERGYQVIARLAPGATLERANAEVVAAARRLEAQYPRENQGWSAYAQTIRELMVGDNTSLIILTMMGAVSFVLLIACANVANLMLARATARHREIAVRAALGAGRGRIIRQLLTESVIVALAAGVLGIGVAWIGLRLIDAGIPPQDAVPFYINWSVDGATLLYTLAVSAATGVLFGLAPALQASKANLQEALKEGSRGSGAGLRRNRLRSSLVVAEVALSLVLLVGASLFVRSFLNLQRKSGGFDTAPLMTLRFYMPGDRYESPRAKTQRVEDVVRRVEALPGVAAATASNLIALSGGGAGGGVVVEGRVVERGEEPRIYWTGVTPHFFQAMDVPLVSGRAFTDAEGRDSSAVAVVSESMARKFWPQGGALGQRFRFADDSAAHWITVIGVARDFYYDDLDERELMPAAFVPYPYLATRNTGLTIRTTGGDPVAVTAAVRREIRASDPALPVFEAMTMDEVRRVGSWDYRLFGWMFSVFGAIALFLAAIGVYGVIAYGVSQRTHEIGVRVALGARGGDVLRLVVGQGVALAAIGVGIGLLGAAGVTQVVKSILFDVSATDPLSYAGVALFLTAVAVLASYLPARRASRVDPIVALRSE